MAGNANSGNRLAGKSLQDKVRKAMLRAIKQGDAGVNGQRALSELLGDLMQSDVARFMQVCGPYMPKEVFIDHSISILTALDEAKRRIIDVTPQTALLEHQQAFIQAPGLDQTQQMADVLCDDENSQGGV